MLVHLKYTLLYIFRLIKKKKNVGTVYSSVNIEKCVTYLYLSVLSF